MKNWKTSTAGILTIVLPLLGLFLKFLQGEPITGADLMMVSTAVPTGTGLLYARDAHVPEVTLEQNVVAAGPTTMKFSE